MVRPKKVMAGTRPKDDEANTSDGGGLMVQSRSRRTIKPNPKYNSKTIVPLKRRRMANSGDETDDMDEDELDEHEHDEDDDDEEHQQDDSQTDDDDFRDDDGGKESDVEETPPSRRRGRPRNADLAAARSEPPASQQQRGRLQQIRAGLKEVSSMSASKIMQQSGMSLDKKRKLDYDDGGADSDEQQQPSVKRRPGVGSSGTPIATRGTRMTTNTSISGGTSGVTKTVVGKENTSVLKKSSVTQQQQQFKMVNIDKIKSATVSLVKHSGTPSATPSGAVGVATRRQQATIITPTTTTTPSPKTGFVRSQVVIGSAGKDTPNARSMIQVRRSTPMASPGTPPPPLAPVTMVAQQKAQPLQSNKERVILNRTPLAKPKITATAAAATPTTTTTRQLATRTVVKSTPSPNTNPQANSRTRLLNAAPSASPMAITSHHTTTTLNKQPVIVPAGAEIERLPDGIKTRVTTLEKRFMIRVQPEDEAVDVKEECTKPPISLLELRSQIRSLKMPSDRWSYQMKLQLRRAAAGGASVPVDTSQDVPEKPGYQVHSVVLNRLVPPPATPTSPKLLNGQKVDMKQYDRSVELLRTQYNVTIDGKPVHLVGAPAVVADRAEVETLLEIVDDITIESAVVKV